MSGRAQKFNAKALINAGRFKSYIKEVTLLLCASVVKKCLLTYMGAPFNHRDTEKECYLGLNRAINAEDSGLSLRLRTFAAFALNFVPCHILCT